MVLPATISLDLGRIQVLSKPFSKLGKCCSEGGKTGSKPRLSELPGE